MTFKHYVLANHLPYHPYDIYCTVSITVLANIVFEFYLQAVCFVLYVPKYLYLILQTPLLHKMRKIFAQ